MSHRLLRRLGAAVVATALLSAGTSLAPANADRGADGGADWLGTQLDKGLVHNDQFDFDDYGLTADVAIALDAVGGSKAKERLIRKALARKVDSWTTGVDFGSNDVYAGSVAKAIVVAQATGANPRKFGKVDLVSRLNRLVGKAGPTKGRISDKTAGTDFANTIGQSFAVQGLAKARSGKADEALRFLLKQQCRQGYFRLGFSPAGQRRQSCDSGTRAQSAPDTDVTALALLSLRSLPKQTPKVRAAVADGVRWLKRNQKGNGSFGGGTSTKGSNTNSTGLAAWALGEAGACKPAVKAARWVKRLQKPSGAIAYDRTGFAAGADGIGRTEKDQWRRATAQASPGLTFLDGCRA